MPRSTPSVDSIAGNKSVYHTMMAFGFIILVVTGIHIWNVRPQPTVYTYMCRNQGSTEGYGTPNDIDDAVNKVLRDRNERRAAAGGMTPTKVTYI